MATVRKPSQSTHAKNRQYTLKLQQPDINDWKLQEKKLFRVVNLPPKFLLNGNVCVPPITNQGQEGSCTGHGTTGVYGYWYPKQFSGMSPILFSPAFQYAMTRIAGGSFPIDSGCTVKDSVKTIAKVGALLESMMPYSDTSAADKPTAAQIKASAVYKSKGYAAVNRDINSIKLTLLNGHPIIFGITIYNSFESPTVAKSGKVPVPKKGEKNLGGHCISMWGYDDSIKCPGSAGGAVLCRNSWGREWGLNGWFWLPYEFFTLGLASDLWTFL